MREWETIKKIYEDTRNLLARYVDAPDELQLVGYIFTTFKSIIRGSRDEKKFNKEIRLIWLEKECYKVEKCSFWFSANWFTVDFTLEHNKLKSWLMKYNEERKVWEICVHDLIIYYINPEFREFLMNIVQRVEDKFKTVKE